MEIAAIIVLLGGGMGAWLSVIIAADAAGAALAKRSGKPRRGEVGYRELQDARYWRRRAERATKKAAKSAKLADIKLAAEAVASADKSAAKYDRISSL
jgi:hypothetical protein